MIGKNKNTCLSKHALNVLIEEQKKDQKSCRIIPERITPRHTVPFVRIKDIRKRVAFIAHLSNLSFREIAFVLSVSHTTIRYWVSECYKIYPAPLTYLHK